DGYMLLPLLLLMIEKYLKNVKLGGVTTVLFFLFLSNYYIAYMAGLYSFIYLLARMYITGRFAKENKPLNTIGRFILRAVLCGLTLCIILVPVGLDTIRNGDPTNSAADSSYVSFNFAGFVDKIFLGYPGEFGEVLIMNMPLIFVSVLVTILCTVYFVSKVFSGREKKLYAAAFIAVYLSLCINYIDVAWQVFDQPNWFWHREAFVFIPLFLTVSYKAFEKLKEIPNSDLFKALGVLFVLLLIAQSIGEMRVQSKIFVYNAAILVILTLILVGLKKTDWKGQLSNMGKILPVILAVLVMYEGVFLAPMLSAGTATLSVFFSEGEDYANHIRTFEDCAEASDFLDNGFRSEYDNIRLTEDQYVGGAPQYADFRSVSLFNSNSNKAFGRFLKQLGYRVNYNYFSASHAYSAPSTDAFFSIGSLYSTEEYSAADFIVEEDLSFYRSRYVLPLAFTVDQNAPDFDFYSLETATTDKNYFDFQNDWYRSLFGSFTDDFFIPIEDGITEELINGTVLDLNDYMAPDEEVADSLQSEDEAEDSGAFDPDNLGLEDVAAYADSKIDVYRTNGKLPIILNYDIVVPNSNEIYLNVAVPRTNGGSEIFLNGNIIEACSPGTFYSTILRLGSYEPGETIRVSITIDQDSWDYVDVNFAYFDEEAFASQFAGVNADAVNVTEADDGYVAFTADVGAQEMVLTSIPYEEGWTATVDGLPMDITPYADALIGIRTGAGTHDVVLTFTPPGLKGGAALSVVGIIGLIVISVLDKNIYNKERKKQPVEEN
ncbi:MAG: YfhO family protein, partial [Clostridiales bacterium]|nr:YfhO family protein [Clostridiales bacterium]